MAKARHDNALHRVVNYSV